MTDRAAPAVQSFSRRDRQSVRDLVFRSSRVHTHLDWQELDDWLYDPDGVIVLARDGGRVVGVMGVSMPLEGACWLRLLVISDFADVDKVIRALWTHVLSSQSMRGVRTVAVLAAQTWVMTPLSKVGFSPIEEIITLERPAIPISAPPPPADLTMRLLRSTDLDTITRIDHAAFAPPWQMERGDLRQAEKIASIGLAALIDGEMVGYALCTIFFEGAHLARLGVLPTMQRRGVATALIAESLWRFARRSVFTMTVNTQASNTQSLNVYQRFGFARTGYDIPVWMTQLPTLSLLPTQSP